MVEDRRTVAGRAGAVAVKEEELHGWSCSVVLGGGRAGFLQRWCG